MNDQFEKFLQKAVAGSGRFPPDTLQDNRVPSTAETCGGSGFLDSEIS
jgi:hypothetical protein